MQVQVVVEVEAGYKSAGRGRGHSEEGHCCMRVAAAGASLGSERVSADMI